MEILLLSSKISEEKHFDVMEKLTEFPNLFQQKVKKYKNWKDAQATLTGRLLLKIGMKRFSEDCDINSLKINKYGKPFFSNNAVKFNISHSHNMVVCALTKKDKIGVDIEYISPINPFYLRYILTEMEWLQILNNENHVFEFYRIWTQKEAVIKALGYGLRIPLKSVVVKNGVANIGIEKLYLTEVIINTSYICHIATSRNNVSVSVSHI